MIDNTLFITFFVILLSSYIDQINGQTSYNSSTIPGRVYPGCALTGDKLYCYGGYSGNPVNNNGIVYTNAFNDHLELDLTAFNSFTSFDPSKIQWTTKANTINANAIPASAHIATTTLSDGSYVMYGGMGGNNQLIDFPLARYHPGSNTWDNIPIPNNNYYLRSQIVNLGNDSVWFFAGTIRTVGQTPQFMLSVYDFKSGNWPVQISYPGDCPIDHTANLVNGIIYIIGGGYLQASNNRTYQMTPANYVQTYNTMDGSWGNFTATGNEPTERCFHTTVTTSDNKYLIMYGGMIPLGSLFQKSTDVYYVLDLEQKSFKNFSLGNPPQSNTAVRFGHYAAIYKTNYLLLAFGYNDLTSPAESFSVLNIQNVFEPSWVTLPDKNNNNNNNNGSSNSTDTNHPSNDVNLKTVIPAVVVPVTVALLGIAVGVFLFMRHRKKKQQKAFVLEQEDPRKTLDNHDYGNLISGGDEEATTVRESNPSRSVKNDHDVNNPLIVNDYQKNHTNNSTYSQHDNNTITYGRASLQSDSLPNPGTTKPFEADPVTVTKPFEP
ncbi:unnamed protein product [Cunninghamella blakesleeana]